MRKIEIIGGIPFPVEHTFTKEGFPLVIMDYPDKIYLDNNVTKNEKNRIYPNAADFEKRLAEFKK